MNKDKETKTENNKIVKRRLYTNSDRKDGARSKFEQFNKEIIRRTKDGSSIRDRIAGMIVHSTYSEWFNAGIKDIKDNIESQYSEFSKKVLQAEHEYRKELISYIKSYGPQDWKAASWLLERSDPDTYKLRDKMDVKQEIEVSQKAILEIPDNGDR